MRAGVITEHEQRLPSVEPVLGLLARRELADLALVLRQALVRLEVPAVGVVAARAPDVTAAAGQHRRCQQHHQPRADTPGARAAGP
ncbi:MAG: hypothetical protein WKG00_13245 [Polyangiaceae bacterium]